MRKLFFLNGLAWYLRWPTKCAIFGIATLVVCFPYPNRLIDHLRHWRDPNALIEPDAPELQPLLAELRSKIRADDPPKQTLRAVERCVYRHVKYDWDWNTWGMADYLPTVAEVMEQGREECDGRAVIAASLLTNLGIRSEIVTDFSHVWVKTEHGETMGPGKRKAVVATPDGLRIQRGALAQIPKSLAFGAAVFPLEREVILVLVLWMLLLRSGGGAACNVTAMALMFGGLVVLRSGGKDHLHPIIWQQLLGVSGLLAGAACLLWWARAHARSGEDGQ